MPRRMSRRPLSRAARLTKEWSPFWTYSPTPADFAPVRIDVGDYFADWIIDPDSAVNLFDEPTVLRTVFQWAIAAAGGGPTPAKTMVSAGIIVCTATGGDPTPLHPRADGWMDWLWTNTQGYFSNPLQDLPALWAYMSPAADTWDIRSKRRLEAGQGLAFIAVNDSNQSTDVMMAATGRVLLAH